MGAYNNKKKTTVAYRTSNAMFRCQMLR